MVKIYKMFSILLTMFNNSKIYQTDALYKKIFSKSTKKIIMSIELAKQIKSKSLSNFYQWTLLECEIKR